MMQTGTGVGATTSKVPSGVTTSKVPSSPLRNVLPGWLQTLLLQRSADDGSRRAASAETIKLLQRDALCHLTTLQRASGLGDYLDFGGGDRTSARSMSKVLRELRLDDVRVLAFDSILTPALRHKHWLRKASVARIGSNLHAPTADVLRSLEPLLLDLAVLIFDPWNEHEEAFEDFLRGHPTLTARRLSSDATAAQSFVVTRAVTV